MNSFMSSHSALNLWCAHLLPFKTFACLALAKYHDSYQCRISWNQYRAALINPATVLNGPWDHIPLDELGPESSETQCGVQWLWRECMHSAGQGMQTRIWNLLQSSSKAHTRRVLQCSVVLSCNMAAYHPWFNCRPAKVYNLFVKCGWNWCQPHWYES